MRNEITKIIEESKTIDIQMAAQEVLTWIINNVENFVDSHSKTYKLDLVLDTSEGLQEIQKLQNLYRSIPEDSLTNDVEKETSEFEEVTNCRLLLDQQTTKILEAMRLNSGLLHDLFGRLIFYYEKMILNPENKRHALKIDEELKRLIELKQMANEDEKKELQLKIVEQIKEGERLIKFEQFEGIVNILKLDYEAFDVGVEIKDEKKIVRKSYVIPEGFTCWFELNYKHKALRPTTLF